ncbi:MAG: 4-(cytidine 5'-diphospho)-2-C-methyl-D-erythritol kinase [Chloroflexi bacterium]|nr:4-(cytidine 5'-diphospho)-2-C-methyl-D-erythritol kinase [Chloroflexota bacterium]MYD49047.1 4-(cytidine 5'-diphospho)-2-C-methyl-D-erythritol kinase [Chloroflexota bacterium]
MGLRISAYAKINLSLEVIGRRDDGYHEIASILQTVDLADTVTLRTEDGLTVECDDASLSGEGNIVWQAAAALANHGGIAPNAHIAIEKRIPVAAGLGGGSADAAAALRGLNRLWGLDLPEVELTSVAASLGSDVPFLLNGGTALATGRGERVQPLSAVDGLPVLLVAPGQTIEAKTPTLYRALGSSDFSSGAETRRLANNVAWGNLTSGDCRNAFERPAKAIFPGLADVWEKTAEIAKHPPQLSGAGPAIFCIPSDEGERNLVVEALRNTGARAYLVRAINPASVV